MANNRIYSWMKGGFSVALFVLLLACEQKTLVAKVNSHKLYREDAEFIMKELGYDINNEADWKTLVDDWVRAKLMSEEIETSDESSALVHQFRAEIFHGELSELTLVDESLLQEIDTVVGTQEIENHYKLHSDEFVLSELIVRGLFLKVSADCPKIPTLKRAYLLKNEKDVAQVESIAKMYAEDFYFDDQQWVFLSELTQRIPSEKFRSGSIGLSRTKTYVSDENHMYFLNILDVKLKNERPPLSFVAEDIRQRILNDRMNDKRRKVQNELLKNLKLKHDFEVHL